MTKPEIVSRRSPRALGRGLALLCIAAIFFAGVGCREKKDKLEDLLRLLCALGIWCPPPPQGCTRCEPYLSPSGPVPTRPGRCVSSYGPSGQSEWVPDDNSLQCGATRFIQRPQGVLSSCVRSTCKATAAGPLALLGYEARPPDDVPPQLAEVVPASGRVLYDDQVVRLRFSESMDPNDVTLGGTLGAEAAPDYAFSRTESFNDTLTLRPVSRWGHGPRALTLALRDEAGQPVSVGLSWHVLAAGTPSVPDFVTCRPGLAPECGQRWFLPYSAQFEASGGVPPYAWEAAPDALAHDADVFRATGFFAWPSGANCLCERFFDVCVSDALGSRTCRQVRWAFGL
jgi:hypothetical protein